MALVASAKAMVHHGDPSTLHCPFFHALASHPIFGLPASSALRPPRGRTAELGPPEPSLGARGPPVPSAGRSSGVGPPHLVEVSWAVWADRGRSGQTGSTEEPEQGCFEKGFFDGYRPYRPLG